VREVNEDCWGVFEHFEKAMDLSEDVVDRKGRLYAVADGMGGHAAGEVASKRAIAVLFQHYYDDPDVDLARSLERAFWAANAEIYAQAATNADQTGMGTTLVAAAIQDDELIVANVGDSRAYLIRNRQAEQISHDHSWVNEQVEAGLLTETEAQTHMYRNIITRSLGSRPDVAVDTFNLPLQVGDVVLLCTDGISNEMELAELAQVVSQVDGAREAARGLIETANRRGGADNLTALVLRVVDVQPPKAQTPWMITGVLAGLVLAGAFVACVSAGLLPATVVPHLWQPKATSSASPTPVIVVPEDPALLITPVTGLGTESATRPRPGALAGPLTSTVNLTATSAMSVPTFPAFGWKIASPPSR
jgi:serine/threonine protein phosphatase PrpC